jgi:hypothetical protein
MVAWDRVIRREVLRAIHEYDRLGAEQFFSVPGFAPATTYELVWDERRHSPQAILCAAYELATGQQLGSDDFEGGKTGAQRVLGKLGFSSRRSYDQPGLADPEVDEPAAPAGSYAACPSPVNESATDLKQDVARAVAGIQQVAFEG